MILKKLLNSGFFCVQCRGYKNYCKVVKGVRKMFVQFRALWQGYQYSLKNHVGCQNFLPDAFRSQKFFNSSKILSALVPGIKKDYSLSSFKPVVPNAQSLNPLKALKNRKVFCCFQGGQKNGALGTNGLILRSFSSI